MRDDCENGRQMTDHQRRATVLAAGESDFGCSADKARGLRTSTVTALATATVGQSRRKMLSAT